MGNTAQMTARRCLRPNIAIGVPSQIIWRKLLTECKLRKGCTFIQPPREEKLCQNGRDPAVIGASPSAKACFVAPLRSRQAGTLAVLEQEENQFDLFCL